VPSGHHGIFLMITLFFFGSWPALRKFSGLPFQQFAVFSITTQFVLSIVWLVSLGNVTGRNAWADSESSIKLLSYVGDDRLRSGAVVLGGFLLGHSDIISCWAMQFLTAGVSFTFYGCAALIWSTLLNLCIQGTDRLPVLLVGLMMAFVGKVLLAAGVVSTKPPVPSSQVQELAEMPATAARVPLQVLEGGVAPLQLHRSQAIKVCIGAGVLCGCWSPLSTFARDTGSEIVAVRNPYVGLFLFALGEFLALPSLLLGAHYIVREPVWRRLKMKQAVFAVLSGSVVSFAYMCFYLASLGVNGAVAYGIGPASAPLVALLIDAFLGAFKDTSRRGKVLLFLCLLCFASAVATLASIS